jgi:hypothetical protein
MNVIESSLTPAQQKAVDDLKNRLLTAKPTVEMFQHLEGTHQRPTHITIELLDGTVYKSGIDFMFTDGLSIVHDNHRIYIPKTAIKSVLVHNPGEM